MAPRPSSIIDPSTGQPFMIDDFDKEIGGPTVSGLRRYPSIDVMRGMSPQRLASILYQVKAGVPRAYFELAEEMEERDPHYTSVLGTRKRAVTRLFIKITPASASPDDVEIANTLRKWTMRKRLKFELFDILDAIGKGLSCTEVIWDKSQPIWMPRFAKRPMTWFQFDQIEKDTPRLRVDGNPAGLELARGKWIVHRHQAKTGISIRSGIAYIIAWTVLFTSFSVADWIAFADTYGQPFRIGKYPPGTDAKAIDLLWDAVAAMGADAAAVVPSSMTMEIVQAAKSDGAMFGTLASYFNRLKSKLVLGQESTTEAIAGGHAVSKEQNEVREDIRDADADLLSATLQEQLVDVWTAINFGPTVEPPQLSLDFEAPEDVKAVIDTAFGLADRGVRVGAQQIRDKVGLVEPEPDDELIGAAARPTNVPPDAMPARDAPQQNARRWLKATAVPRIEQAVNAARRLKLESDIEAQLEKTLIDAGQPLIDGWAAQIRKAMNSAASLEEFAVAMMELYPELDAEPLAIVMGQAMALANVSGRDLDA